MTYIRHKHGAITPKLKSRLTGSHPANAGKPFVSHPGLEPFEDTPKRKHQYLESFRILLSLYSPLWISFSAAEPTSEYRNGFKNPSGLRPTLTSSSFKREMTLAKIGLEQLVPATRTEPPASMISTLWPIAATSGNARPLGLNRPAFVRPSCARYFDTAAA